MTSRALIVAAGTLTLIAVAACSGDPGTSIPTSANGGGSAPGTSSPPATGTDPAATSSPGATPKAGGPLSLTVAVAGTGHVTSQPAGIDCPGQCSAKFASGTKVTLVAAPAEGWKLTTWSGACTGSAACAVTITADAKVTGSLALLDERWDPSFGAGDCVDAWGKAGEKLSPCDQTKDDYVVVRKSKRNVALCKSGKLVKNLRSGLGFAPTGDKVQEGDGKTPEGVFYVPELLPESSYYKAFLISYPLPEDAARGVQSGLITSAVRAQIESANAACVTPPQDTGLGGEVEIHGDGSSKDWTNGCVALDDPNVDLLWSSIGVHDTIVVLP